MKMSDITAKDHEARKGMNSPLSVMAFLGNMWKVMWTQVVLFMRNKREVKIQDESGKTNFLG